jgi:transcriptional regulator with XRE-family HTH domain
VDEHHRHRDNGVFDKSSQAVSPRIDLWNEALLPILPDYLDRKILRDQESLAEYEDARLRLWIVRALATVRRLKGLSQGQVAERMGTSQSAISDLEKGTKDPRLSTLQRLARTLGFSMHMSLFNDYWILWYSWEQRTVPYTPSSIEPVRYEETTLDLWREVLASPSETVFIACDVEMVRMIEVKPVTSLDPHDDNYLTRRDLVQMAISAQSRPLAILGADVD